MIVDLEHRLRHLGEHVDAELVARRSDINSNDGDKLDVPEFSGSASSQVAGRRTRPRRVLTLLSAAAVVGVCGVGLIAVAGRGDDSQGTLASGQAATSAAGPTSEGPAESGLEQIGDAEEFGPFRWSRSELLGRVYTALDLGTADEVGEAVTGPVSAREVADCMSAAGFHYAADSALAGDPRWTMEPDEFAARYGLGILAQTLGTYPVPQDPNQEYLDSMSESEREAFAQTLDRCATGEIGNEGSEFVAAYQASIDQFRGVVMSDERVVLATVEWSQCMEFSGYAYTDLQEMKNSFWAATSLTGQELQDQYELELLVAAANVSCEAAYTAIVRGVIADRLDIFTTMLESGSVGSTPGANG